jgi:hypothetical protein
MIALASCTLTKPPNALRSGQWAGTSTGSVQAWTLFGSRKNSKPEKCLKIAQNPQRPVRALLGCCLLQRRSLFKSFLEVYSHENKHFSTSERLEHKVKLFRLILVTTINRYFQEECQIQRILAIHTYIVREAKRRLSV